MTRWSKVRFLAILTSLANKSYTAGHSLSPTSSVYIIRYKLIAVIDNSSNIFSIIWLIPGSQSCMQYHCQENLIKIHIPVKLNEHIIMFNSIQTKTSRADKQNTRKSIYNSISKLLMIELSCSPSSSPILLVSC